MIRRFQRDDGFKHRQRRGIGRRIGLTGFAENGERFRNLLQLSILDLKNFRRLGNRHSRHRGGHVEQRSFIERRHEFASQFFERENRDDERDRRANQREPAIAQNKIDAWLIYPDQKPVHWIVLLRCDFAADQKKHENRHERHAEKRGEEH